MAMASWRTAAVTLLSFSSGLPLGLVWIAIPDWLRTAGVDIRMVGLVTLAQAPSGAVIGIATLRLDGRLCDEHLVGRFDLEVHDLNQEPWLARDAQIIAAPTLVREQPLPVQRIIGSLSDVQRVLVGLGFPPHEPVDP